MFVPGIPGFWVLTIGWLALDGCASGPTAVVNTERALHECRDGRVAREEIRARFVEYQAMIDQQKQELKAKIDVIEADRARGLDVREREANARRRLSELQDQFRVFQSDLDATAKERSWQIFRRLAATLKDLQAARGIKKVVDANPTPPADGHRIDLTPDLVRAVDAQPPLTFPPYRTRATATGPALEAPPRD
jgi:Skp family chaperone for outer membrane proteins